MDCLINVNCPRGDGDVVDENRGHGDPGDAEPSVHQAVRDGSGDHVRGHAKDDQGNQNGGEESAHGGAPCSDAADGKEIDQDADRSRGGNRGEPGIAKRIEILEPDSVHARPI